jgi:hypothetical protein
MSKQANTIQQPAGTTENEAIAALVVRSRQIRNSPLAALCETALRGDPAALLRVTHILTAGHDMPRGPLTSAERNQVISNGLDPDEIEASMLARQAAERAGCSCMNQSAA